MIDAARLVALAAELEWLAGELRAAVPVVEDNHDPLLSEREAAELAGLTADAMKHHRHRQTSPVVSRDDGRIAYRKSAVVQWIERRARAGIGTRTGLASIGNGDGES